MGVELPFRRDILPFSVQFSEIALLKHEDAMDSLVPAVVVDGVNTCGSVGVTTRVDCGSGVTALVVLTLNTGVESPSRMSILGELCFASSVLAIVW